MQKNNAANVTSQQNRLVITASRAKIKSHNHTSPTSGGQRNETMRKQVTQLTAGDIIDPPAGEKVWLWKDGIKRRYTVVSVSPGKVTKKGQFVQINCTCDSPYSVVAGKQFNINCEMIETKTVRLHSEKVVEECDPMEDFNYAGSHHHY